MQHDHKKVGSTYVVKLRGAVTREVVKDTKLVDFTAL